MEKLFGLNTPPVKSGRQRIMREKSKTHKQTRAVPAEIKSMIKLRPPPKDASVGGWPPCVVILNLHTPHISERLIASATEPGIKAPKRNFACFSNNKF